MTIEQARKEKTEFNLVFALTFLVMLVAVGVGRLLPKSLRWNVSGGDEHKTVFGAAKAAAYATTPFAFM